MSTETAILDLARLSSQWKLSEHAFWTTLVRAYDAGELSYTDAAYLIGKTEGTAPSRATIYRRLAYWREIAAEQHLPGLGS